MTRKTKKKKQKQLEHMLFFPLLWLFFILHVPRFMRLFFEPCLFFLLRRRVVAAAETHLSLCFLLASVDGSTLATGGADCTVRTWDVAGAFEAATAKAEDACVAPLSAHYCFRTKSTPVMHVRWTRRNVLLAGGAFELS
jgi:hypothetical protein